MFLDNKYTKCYYKIIENAKNRLLSEYKEKHHIIPKSLGGSDEKYNLVDLTAKEHYLCHWLLTKCVDGQNKYKMIVAFTGMRFRKNRNLSSFEYSKVKEYISKSKTNIPRSEETKKKISEGRKGIPNTDEQKRKISEALKGSKKPKSFSEKMSKIHSGKITSNETKRKISEALKGRKLTAEQKLVRSINSKKMWEARRNKGV